MLLQDGIGDTIRVSLTPAPGGDRTEEVRVGQQILQSMGIRSFTPQVTACPGCGRTTSTFFQEMAEQIQTYLREQMPEWKGRYVGVEEMKVAVMGCVVNGPGESKHASLGISLPGTFEEPKAPVYIDGRLFTTLKGDHIVANSSSWWISMWKATTRHEKKWRQDKHDSARVGRTLLSAALTLTLTSPSLCSNPGKPAPAPNFKTVLVFPIENS